MKYLGEYLDIHCGGIDNAFPHHTNEIAQSEAYLGHKWCNYWFHVHHLNTNHGKMSKSSGEFLTVSLLEEKGYDPLIYRLFCLQSHYRKTLVFSYENLDNAAKAYRKLVDKIAALDPKDAAPVDTEAETALREKFKAALDNDLNTALAVTSLYDVLKAKTSDSTKLAMLSEIDSVLGLGLLTAAEKARAAKPKAAAGQTEAVFGEGDPEIDALVLRRQQARKEKNWAEADRIRDELTNMGITLVDTKEGVHWSRS